MNGTIRATRHQGVLVLHVSLEVSLGDKGFGSETDDRVLCDVVLEPYDLGQLLAGSESASVKVQVPDEVRDALQGTVKA